MLEGLKTLLQKNQIDIDVEFNTNKVLRNGSQWGVGNHRIIEDKDYYDFHFGDYKTGLDESWRSWVDSDIEALTPEQKAQADKAHKETQEKIKREKEKIQLDVALELATEFDSFTTEGLTPYLTKKGITKLFGAKIKANEHGDPILVYPLKDINGVLWNTQRIYSQRLSAGNKFFAPGARIEGCFHTLQGEIKDEATVYLCEGGATACSVALALGSEACVVAAFNANNLSPVATSIKEAFPSCKIVVCADNDAYTIIKNKPYNVGLEKGRRAAGAVSGTCVWPIFRTPQKGFTDFNDMHLAEGLEIVKEQILHPEKFVKGIQPMCLDSKNGKVSKPTDKQVAEYVHSQYKDKILKKDKDLFKHVGTHWELISQNDQDEIRKEIQTAANGLLNIKDIKNYFEYFRMLCPPVPHNIDMFQPNPFAANFSNGTLHFWRNGDKKYHVEFRKHDSTDYLTSVLPFEYPHWQPGQPLPPAPRFDKMIETLWSNNQDKEEIKRFVYQLGGACLAPAFPIIALFYGKPKSGKSTLIKLLVKMLTKENVCSVQLCEMQRFNMETMMGKLVNFDTDIDTTKPMNDSEVKKIIDRVPRRVQRKGIKDVYAYIPAVHLFAANRLPKSLDGSSHAYGHRMVLIKTESFKAQPTDETDFEDNLLKYESPGIIARFVMGLYDLCENFGKFTAPSSNEKNILELENDSDITGRWIQDGEENEIMDKNSAWDIHGGKIKRSLAWEKFNAHQQDAVMPNQRIGKHEFFKEMEKHGFEVETHDGIRYFKSMRVDVQKDAIG